jgi:hypothetical protein
MHRVLHFDEKRRCRKVTGPGRRGPRPMDGTPTSQPLIGNYGTVGSVSFAKALNPGD